MAIYIKANPKVARYLRLENDRNKVKDGNFLLWQADMLAFGKLIDLPEILSKIGAIALQAHEAREEQDGTEMRKLPDATDPQFLIGVADETSSENPIPENIEKEEQDSEQPTEEAVGDENPPIEEIPTKQPEEQQAIEEAEQVEETDNKEE